MKVLLDECVPKALSALLPGHDVITVPRMGWSSLKNGALIAIADPLFDVFVTIDKNLRYQQNLTRIRMSIVLLDMPNNKLSTILSCAPALHRQLTIGEAG